MPTERAETGPVQFGDDWPGVFFRGDIAAYCAQVLQDLVLVLPLSPTRVTLESLSLVLGTSRVPCNPVRLKSYSECLTNGPQDQKDKDENA